jgi:hypothetical protein
VTSKSSQEKGGGTVAIMKLPIDRRAMGTAQAYPVSNNSIRRSEQRAIEDEVFIA